MAEQLNHEVCDAPTHSLEEHNERKSEIEHHFLCHHTRTLCTISALDHLVSSWTLCNQKVNLNVL